MGRSIVVRAPGPGHRVADVDRRRARLECEVDNGHPGCSSMTRAWSEGKGKRKRRGNEKRCKPSVKHHVCFRYRVNIIEAPSSTPSIEVPTDLLKKRLSNAVGRPLCKNAPLTLDVPCRRWQTLRRTQNWRRV